MRAAARHLLASALLLLSSNPAVFSYTQVRSPCKTPIKYRIGTLDPRFGLSREEFQRAIDEASNVWATDQKHFQYDSKGVLQINLVYDTRQEVTQRVISIRARVSATMKETDLIKNKLLPLEDNFHILETSYSDRQISYERDQDSYNQEVKRWNLAGGAPESEFQILNNQRLSLKKQYELLQAKRQALNRATDELNELIKKRNALLVEASAEVRDLNGSAGVQFEEGLYVKAGSEERIDIFEFENKDSLLVILAHELGHALGLEHNANPSSIMSPLIHTDRLALTAEDAEGLKAVCAR